MEIEHSGFLRVDRHDEGMHLNMLSNTQQWKRFTNKHVDKLCAWNFGLDSLRIVRANGTSLWKRLMRTYVVETTIWKGLTELIDVESIAWRGITKIRVDIALAPRDLVEWTSFQRGPSKYRGIKASTLREIVKIHPLPSSGLVEIGVIKTST